MLGAEARADTAAAVEPDVEVDDVSHTDAKWFCKVAFIDTIVDYSAFCFDLVPFSPTFVTPQATHNNPRAPNLYATAGPHTQ